ISEDGLTITNEYLMEEVSLSVNKIWEDTNNQDGIRPESIIVILFADGAETDQELTLSEENDWAGSFTGLPTTDSAGNEIIYTIKEVTVDGYESEIVIDEDNPLDFTLINTHEPELIDIEGTKFWEDDEDRDSIRPE